MFVNTSDTGRQDKGVPIFKWLSLAASCTALLQDRHCQLLSLLLQYIQGVIQCKVLLDPGNLMLLLYVAVVPTQREPILIKLKGGTSKILIFNCVET